MDRLSESGANKFFEPALKSLPSYKHILDADTMTLPQVLIMYHQNNTLCQFIEKFLVNAYVKKGGDKQAMWFSKQSLPTLQNKFC